MDIKIINSDITFNSNIFINNNYKYKIKLIKNNNNNCYCRLYEYNKIKNEYKLMFESFNAFSFIEQIKKYLKYFYIKEKDIINFARGGENEK